MINYTRGEWQVESGTQVVCGDRLVANTGGYSNNYSFPRAENEANAKLIAASPRLYEALKAFDDYLKAGYPGNMRLKKIAVDKMEEALALIERAEETTK